MPVIRRALVSVFDKTGLVPLCQALHDLGIEMISTGGTARTIAEAGLPVTPVSSMTGFPEILDGRVKTLHPKIHGGLLAIQDKPEHLAELEANGITPIGLVVSNLYPFAQTIAKPGVTIEEAIEMIDIGGPCMIRASAKNHAFVTVLTDASQYEGVLAELRANGCETTLTTRRRLALAAFAHTSAYDSAIVEYLCHMSG